MKFKMMCRLEVCLALLLVVGGMASAEHEGLVAHWASDPTPEDEATDIWRDLSLSWTSGLFAATHNVYFGANFDDVNQAGTADPGEILIAEGLTEPSIVLDRLTFDQTYYWRVDEVNGAPDFTVLRGEIWTFSVEPLAYPITNITAAASNSFGISLPEKTIDGSGLVGGLHGTDAADMWLSKSIPAIIEYAFDRAYKVHELWIWNANQLIERFVGFGAKDVAIQHSLDGENWTVLAFTRLARAPGKKDYAHNNTIDFGATMAQYVRITIDNTQGGMGSQASLSEVRFFLVPKIATRPNPDSGATNVAPDVTLSWGANGREADRHEVYLGTDPNNLPFAGDVSESSFDTLSLDLQLGQSYAWRVDEVNEAMDPSTWGGTVWRFTTADSIPVDDMERYEDAQFLEIWATWIDGFDDPANGSLVGNGGAGAPETGIVHGGNQSLPLHYDNRTAAQSEATRTFDTPMDWTRHGVEGLVLYFQGDPSNTGGRLYVKINDTKVSYGGGPADLMSLGWSRWYVPLSALTGTDLSRVTALTIGVDSGGTGVVYIDDVVLTHAARE